MALEDLIKKLKFIDDYENIKGKFIFSLGREFEKKYPEQNNKTDQGIIKHINSNYQNETIEGICEKLSEDFTTYAKERSPIDFKMKMPVAIQEYKGKPLLKIEYIPDVSDKELTPKEKEKKDNELRKYIVSEIASELQIQLRYNYYEHDKKYSENEKTHKLYYNELKEIIKNEENKYSPDEVFLAGNMILQRFPPDKYDDYVLIMKKLKEVSNDLSDELVKMIARSDTDKEAPIVFSFIRTVNKYDESNDNIALIRSDSQLFLDEIWSKELEEEEQAKFEDSDSKNEGKYRRQYRPKTSGLQQGKTFNSKLEEIYEKTLEVVYKERKEQEIKEQERKEQEKIVQQYKSRIETIANQKDSDKSGFALFSKLALITGAVAITAAVTVLTAGAGPVLALAIATVVASLAAAAMAMGVVVADTKAATSIKKKITGSAVYKFFSNLMPKNPWARLLLGVGLALVAVGLIVATHGFGLIPVGFLGSALLGLPLPAFLAEAPVIAAIGGVAGVLGTLIATGITRGLEAIGFKRSSEILGLDNRGLVTEYTPAHAVSADEQKLIDKAVKQYNQEQAKKDSKEHLQESTEAPNPPSVSDKDEDVAPVSGKTVTTKVFHNWQARGAGFFSKDTSNKPATSSKQAARHN